MTLSIENGSTANGVQDPHHQPQAAAKRRRHETASVVESEGPSACDGTLPLAPFAAEGASAAVGGSSGQLRARAQREGCDRVEARQAKREGEEAVAASELKRVGGKREGYLVWDDYFMSVAFLSAMRSKDPSTQVGAW